MDITKAIQVLNGLEETYSHLIENRPSHHDEYEELTEAVRVAKGVMERVRSGEIVEVVRCAQCKFRGTSGCATEGFPIEAYCPYGKKRGAE